MTSWSKGYVRTRLGRIHYRMSTRTGSRPGLVLLHQTASSSVMYEALMERLAGEFVMFAPDTPGFGESDPLAGPVTVAAWAEALYEAMQTVDLETAFIFGHHTGASIAVEIEVAHPGTARRLVLSGPPAMTREERASFGAKVERLAPAEDGSHLLSIWARVRRKDPEAPLALLTREAALTLAAGPGHRAACDAVLGQELLAMLAELRCPTLVMAGDRDLLHPYLDRAYRSLSQGEKLVLRGAGTYLCERDVEEVAAVLRRFCLEATA